MTVQPKITEQALCNDPELRAALQKEARESLRELLIIARPGEMVNANRLGAMITLIDQ